MIQTTSQNFASLFSWKEEDVQVSGITIPIVQRDYAQGRLSQEVTRIRNRFLQVLYESLVEDKKIKLDFIYGSVEKGMLIPLDGQQRLTTLFLLHYYIALHENVPPEDRSFLRRFTYETRVSSREFCQQLLNFTPDFSKENMSEQIKDEAWFLMEWESDPTVQAMLVMLDAIHEKFVNTNSIWEKLMGDNITFYFLPLQDMGVTDELYIKMNSRGKALTPFEHFKAELELRMKEVDEELAKEIIKEFDCEWSDMLWPFRNSGLGDAQDNVTDDEFLRYVRFISDIIGYQNGETEIADEFEIIEKRFSKACPKAKSNIEKLKSAFDIWVNCDIAAFFNSFISIIQHEEGKILMEVGNANLFGECCRTYGLRAGRRPLFSLGQTLMLYAFIIYLLHQRDVSEDEFRHRIRIVNNLVKNSSNEIRSDNMSVLLQHVKIIILKGEILTGGFQTTQVEEELVKQKWIKTNPEMAETLFRLEDHKYLNGYVRAVVGERLEHVDWCDRFYSLFECDLILVTNALLSIGDYFEKDAWRYQIGTSNPRLALGVWRSLFSPTRLENGLCIVLQDLLSKYDSFINDVLKNIIHDYIQSAKEMPVRYYMAKYPQMQKSRWGGEYRFGKYYWRQHWENGRETYHVLMMTTEVSLGGMNYDIFLKTLFELGGGADAGLELGDYSYSQYNGGGLDKLRMTKQHLYLTLAENEYKIYSENEEVVTEIETRHINQNDDGIDIEDRVEIGMQLLKKYI